MGSCYGQKQKIIVIGLNSPESNESKTNIYINFETLPSIITDTRKRKVLGKPILEKLMIKNYQKKECVKEFLETHSF